MALRSKTRAPYQSLPYCDGLARDGRAQNSTCPVARWLAARSSTSSIVHPPAAAAAAHGAPAQQRNLPVPRRLTVQCQPHAARHTHAAPAQHEAPGCTYARHGKAPHGRAAAAPFPASSASSVQPKVLLPLRRPPPAPLLPGLLLLLHALGVPHVLGQLGVVACSAAVQRHRGTVARRYSDGRGSGVASDKFASRRVEGGRL